MYDAIIIGGGVTGSSVAFYLSKNEGKFLLLEKHEDVCCETSKANSGICHGGYDAQPGTMKAKMNVKGNQMMEELSKTLSFRSCLLYFLESNNGSSNNHPIFFLGFRLL